MKRFYEIMKECNMDSIRHYFKKIFHLNKIKLKEYMTWYNRIIKTEPKEICNTIFIIEDKKECDVFYIQSENPSDVDRLEHYGLMDLFFPKLFGMYVYENFKIKKEEFVVRVLYENTWFGLYDEDKKESFEFMEENNEGSFVMTELPLDGAYNSKRWIYNLIKTDKKVDGIAVLPINYDDALNHYRFGAYYEINGKCFKENSLTIPIKKLNCYIEAFDLMDRYDVDVCILKDIKREKLFIIERDKYNSCNF